MLSTASLNKRLPKLEKFPSAVPMELKKGKAKR